MRRFSIDSGNVKEDFYRKKKKMGFRFFKRRQSPLELKMTVVKEEADRKAWAAAAATTINCYTQTTPEDKHDNGDRQHRRRQQNRLFQPRQEEAASAAEDDDIEDVHGEHFEVRPLIHHSVQATKPDITITVSLSSK
jgi:hypothetical protein